MKKNTLNSDTQAWAYTYDPATHGYLFPVRIFPSPDGSYTLPEHAVDFSPGLALGPHQRYRLNAPKTAWLAVHDYREVTLWSKQTAWPVPNNLRLGDSLPTEVTSVPPITVAPDAPQRNRWNDEQSQWELEPDYSRHLLWEKSTGQHAATLSPGKVLPEHLTLISPPRDEAGPFRWDETAQRWCKTNPLDYEITMQGIEAGS